MKRAYSLFLIISLMVSCENGLIGLGERVDIDPPEITIGQYADGSPISNGDYVRGQIKLSGNVSDDIGVSAVNLTILDTATSDVATGSAVIDYKTMTWTYGIDTAEHGDGEKEITIEVLDTSSSPKRDSLQRLLFFDNTAPLILITEPGDYEPDGGLTNSIITLKGEIEDQFKLESVEIELLSGTGTVDPIDAADVSSGIWTSALRSSGTGQYEISVTATDKAGNRTRGFYHKKDVYAANDNIYITTKDIYDIREGELVQPSGLTREDLLGSGLLLSVLPLNIDLKGDEPQMSISNPDPSATAAENTLPGNSRAIGSITDDDGIDVSSIKISIDGASFEPVSSNGTVSGSGLYVQWEYDLSSLGSGDHTLQLYAEDYFGVFKYSPVVPFRINLGAPVISIDTPLMGSYINSSGYTVSGTATDGEGVTDIHVSLDNGLSWTPVSISPSTNVSWSLSSGAVSDGLQSIKVRASDDNRGTWSYSNMQFTVDTSAPVTGFIYPAKGSYVNGEVVIRGASSDNSSLIKTEIRVGESRGWIELQDDRYNWTYSVNSLEYENDIDAVETPADSGIYRLNVYSRVTDIAGNVTVTETGDFFFNIDNSLDRPTVNIIAPSPGASLGGSVLVSGTSFDDDGEVYEVAMQIDVDTAPGQEPDFADTAVDLGVAGIDFDGPEGNPQVTVIDETAWYRVDGKSPWSVELNTNGELYDTDGSGPHRGDIHIRVRATDKNGGDLSITGDYKELHIRLDDTIPYAENLYPPTGSYVKDSFSLTGKIIDETLIKHLEISYNGGANYHYIIKNSNIQVPYGAGGVTKEYLINTLMDTSSIPDVGGILSGDLTIRLKVTDSTNYQSLYSLRYFIDNSDPTAAMVQDLSDIHGADEHSRFFGEANDSGSVSGINRIEAYFEKGGYFYDPRDGSTIVATNNDIDGNTVPYPSDPDYLVVVDSIPETLNGSDYDGDGINEQLNIGDPYDWIFDFDSALIPDGAFTFHYIAYDNSENAVHNTRAGIIRNNPPVIESITLGTDINGTGGIGDSEKTVYFPDSFTSTDFTGINNQLSIKINTLENSGNGTLSYSITYNGGENLTSGAEAVIDTENFDDILSNGAEFICTVTDSAGLSTTESISLNIDNIDDQIPTIAFGELDAVTSVPEVNGEPEGHIEERSWSVYNNDAISDPDVSGRIILNGYAHDDQRIKNIHIYIDLNNDGDFDDTGERILLADADTDGTLKSVGDAAITMETLTEISGHNVYFTYEWDSSSLTGQTGKNIHMELVAEDYGFHKNNTIEYDLISYNAMTLDVVPYISSVETLNLSEGGIKAQNIRSVEGKYSIKSGSTSGFIRINGFNLDPIPEGARVASPSFKTGLDGTVPVGDSLTIDSVDGDYRYVLLSNDSAGSGYFSLLCGTVADPIPTINNINSDRPSNRETRPESGHETLTDDRYFRFFNVTSTGFADSYYPNMMMEGNDPVFGFIQGGAANDLQVRKSSDDSNSFGLVRILAADQMAMARDDDGIYHYATVNSFNNGRMMYIYNFFETTPFYGNGAATGPYWSNYTGVYSNGINNNALDLDSVNYTPGLQLGRYQNLQMKVMGSSISAGEYSKVYMAWYDNNTGEILFRNFRVGRAGGSVGLYGGIRSNQADIGVTGGDGSREVVTGQASAYLTMGVTDDDIVVIVYYNQATGFLNLIHSENPVDRADTSTDIQWSAPRVINLPYTGWYVSMHIETNGDGNGANDPIHIAAYDTVNADLRYIYLDSYADTAPSAARVDAINSVGIYSDIKVIDGKPCIAYYNNSENGTRDSIKMAVFKRDPAVSVEDGAFISGLFTGEWEVCTVPVNTPPHGGLSKFMKVNIDFNLSGDPVVGYSADSIEYSVPLDEF